MLMPKRMKHRKVQRGRRRGFAKGGANIDFGDFGLKILENGWITSRQIEAARVALTRKVRRGFISEKYEELIEALYSDKTHIGVEADVIFEDGRTGTIKADLAIRDAAAAAIREAV